MKTTMTVAVVVVLAGVLGCSARGGSAADEQGFRIGLPVFDTQLRQGQTESIKVSLYRGDPSPVVATDLTIRMKCRIGAAPEYVTTYLSFLYQKGYWREVAGGASGSMKKITRSQLQRLPIPLPDMPEQLALAELLHSRVVATREIQRRVADEGEALAALPSAVIRRAFKGVD